MERIPSGLYTHELRSETVKQVEQEGLSVDKAAKRLLFSRSSLGNLVKASRTGKLAEIGQRLPLNFA